MRVIFQLPRPQGFKAAKFSKQQGKAKPYQLYFLEICSTNPNSQVMSCKTLTYTVSYHFSANMSKMWWRYFLFWSQRFFFLHVHTVPTSFSTIHAMPCCIGQCAAQIQEIWKKCPFFTRRENGQEKSRDDSIHSLHNSSTNKGLITEPNVFNM